MVVLICLSISNKHTYVNGRSRVVDFRNVLNQAELTILR
jgi:hypothetical protein